MEQGNPGGQEGKDWKRKTAEAAVVGLAVGAILTGGEVGGRMRTKDLSFGDAMRDLREEVKPSVCQPVEAVEATRVTREIRQPAPTDIPVLNPDNGSPEWETFQKEYHNYAEERAEAHGFHLIDDTKARQEIKDAHSPAEVLSALNGYTKELGFDVEVQAKDPDSNLPVDAKKFQQGASAMVAQLYYMPRELFQIVDLKSVTIKETLNTMENPVIGHAKVSGDMNMRAGKMRLALTTFYDKNISTINHEIGHRLDYISCGNDSGIDKDYTDINTNRFKYGTKNTLELYQNVNDAYGATSIWEDKAVIYGQMLNGLTPSMIAENAGRVDEKYRFLLARLDVMVPGMAAYLSELGGGSNPARSKTSIRYSNADPPANPYQKDQLSNYIQKRKPDKVG